MFTEPPTPTKAKMAETQQPPRKFMFDVSFDGATAANRPPPERKPVTLKADQLDAIKQEMYESGFSAGRKIAADEHTRQLSELMAAIARNLDHLLANIEQQQQNHDHDIRQVIMAIAKKILPEYTARNGLDEIHKILSEAISEMVHEPRLVVRTHQQQFDAINSHINDVIVKKAYAGKVVVLADADIALGDCRIEWADGGIERNTQSVWNTIESAILPESAPLPHQE